MSFNSWQFLLFFPLVTSLYFAMPHRYRWVLLLLASYFFYACSIPAYALLLGTSTIVDYYAGLLIDRMSSSYHRKMALMVSLFVNLALLCFFKYYNFFTLSLTSLVQWLGLPQFELPYSHLLLPAGISFYTFQTLSYTIDVYRRRLEPERHLGRFALFVSFFPQLVAGPIERATDLLPQFRDHHSFNYDRAVRGSVLIAWGLFKKMVVADRLAVVVNAVYNAPESMHGVHYTIATVCFAFQIYCDFSGYSDTAIGCAEVLGFRLMKNFDHPYAARTISEFWSRWHISLSTWFRDYLYIPLGGNRVSAPRWYLNLWIVFIVSGLWHGASWTFVLWGALHGTFLVVGLITKPLRERIARACRLDKVPSIHHAMQRLAVFAMVCFSWILFRANSVSDAFTILSRLGTGWLDMFQEGWWRATRIQMDTTDKYLVTALVLIAILEVVEKLHSQDGWQESFARRHWSLRWACYAAITLAIVNLGAPQPVPFIYFQF